ncbi:MAG: ATP synthase F1 subunit gamma [Candidatus Omnitrophica bacterium]|nr:ATP synthase F1 subunit gamma [Candidatus Omnitrophota bacterium]
MPTIKEYDKKLSSLKNTYKMTRTMKLVAMSKLYRAQENQRKAKSYSELLTDLIHRISRVHNQHPLMLKKESVKKILILVFTSDKGLCGSFNNQLIKQVATWIRSNPHLQVDMSFAGKRGYMFFKKITHVKRYYEGSTANPDFQTASDIGKEISDDFINGVYDEVYVAYNTYHSPLSQTAIFEKVLPIEPKSFLKDGTSIPATCIFEPAQDELLQFLVPKYLYFRIYFTFLENAAGEHGARMMAMESASKNAEDLMERYMLLRNRARQAAITTELIEIIGGAEALKG